MMKSLAPGIEVNGIKITPDEINAEVQYHPAASLVEAKVEAMQALVIRELLLQRAAELGLCDRENAVKNSDSIIDDLLDREVITPEPDEDTCARYYENNKKKFITSPLFDVAHILYLAPPEDGDLRTEAKKKAIETIKTLQKNPEAFEDLARLHSACSSAKEGGRLGQISKGQTMPGFETALFSMKEGEISQKPVQTEVGYHVIKVFRHAEGKQLPFDAVREWIKNSLQTQSHNRAFCQYVQLLAGRAKISGFRLMGETSTPLVQ